jgi:hypothetical protein
MAPSSSAVTRLALSKQASWRLLHKRVGHTLMVMVGAGNSQSQIVLRVHPNALYKLQPGEF